MICPKCSSEDVIKNGFGHNDTQHYKCKKCGYDGDGFTTSSGSSYEEGDNFINVVCASERLLTKDAVIKKFKINTDIWEVEKFKIKTSEGYRKDRAVSWKVEGGVVIEGDVKDSGKMLVVPLYHIQVSFRRKRNAGETKQELIKQLKKYSPKITRVKYNPIRSGSLLEVDVFDLHYGKHSWGKETGDDYDIDIVDKLAKESVIELINYSKGFPISKILFPVGNDFFNVDNKSDTTASGTPQQEDTRWKKTFKRGRQLIVDIIDLLQSVAPVEVLVIPGNHDLERTFYLGDALECWFHNNKNVKVDNSPPIRKYYRFGKCLIGYAHGKDEKINDLPTIMAIEKPELYAKTKYREWHLGDKHHKKAINWVSINEERGVTVRILRSLTAADSWHSSKGYIGSLRGSEAFVWDYDKGLVAQFSANL